MSFDAACTRKSFHRGFTLIEVLITVAIVAILAAIALPSYESYVKKSRAKGAATDLMALSMVLENRFQKSLKYPAYAESTLIPGQLASRSGAVATDFGAWVPAQGAYFSYSIESTASSYTVKAKGSGALQGCTLSLTDRNVRNSAGDCSILGSW